MFSVVILAGGLATRLRPLTEEVPKSLITVAGKPFIDWQLIYLARQGVTHVVLCIGHLGRLIQDHVGDGSRFGLCVEYSYDGVCSLGTGGAIKKALPLLDDGFFVLYGDSYLMIDYYKVEALYKHSSLPALMTVFKNNNKLDNSNVVFDGNNVVLYDKVLFRQDMFYIDYGLSVLSKDVFLQVSDDSFDLANVLSYLSKNNLLAGFEVYERFYEIGSHNGLAEFAQFIVS